MGTGQQESPYRGALLEQLVADEVRLRRAAGHTVSVEESRSLLRCVTDPAIYLLAKGETKHKEPDDGRILRPVESGASGLRCSMLARNCHWIISSPPNGVHLGSIYKCLEDIARLGMLWLVKTNSEWPSHHPHQGQNKRVNASRNRPNGSLGSEYFLPVALPETFAGSTALSNTSMNRKRTLP